MARCKHRTQKIDKNSPSAHDRTILSGSVFATKVSTIGKILKQQYVFHMSSQYGELRPTNHQPNIAQDVWPSAIHFMGSYPLTEFCPVQNSLYIQVLRSPILTALLNGTPAAGVSQTLRCGKNVLFLTAMLPCCDGEIKLYIKGMELLNFDKERHLYSARLLSLWASAHILIIFCRAHYNKLVARISLLVARSDVYYAICCN